MIAALVGMLPAVGWLIQRPELSPRNGDPGQRLVEKRYDIGKVSRWLLETCETVLGNRQSRASNPTFRQRE